jgi:hypothetical protein
MEVLRGLLHVECPHNQVKVSIPMIDELLDELSNASWFSMLDLRAGFNQIRLAPGEEYKMVFQTH